MHALLLLTAALSVCQSSAAPAVEHWPGYRPHHRPPHGLPHHRPYGPPHHHEHPGNYSTEPHNGTHGAGPKPPVQVAGGFWLGNIDHSKDTVWQNSNTGYTVFRNVMDYGAVGDGVTDDTAAINKAVSDGQRCGGLPTLAHCDSSTVTPAIVYFPGGKVFKVSTPILMFYYTQFIGDATNPPTLLASSDFVGMAVLDSDPYIPNGNGANWYTNQNNFFRQVRNFVIDIRQWGGGTGAAAGIHWQVAQATSLQNIVFQLSSVPGNKQQGVFMDNGSGGFFSDLVFNNGFQGAFLGSQQFTSRNLTFNNCETAIFMNWNWGWTLHGVTVNGGNTALNMATTTSIGVQNQTVGSVVLSDSTITGVQYGVRTAYQDNESNNYPSGGTLILDNVDMSGVSIAAVVNYNNETVLAPGFIHAWAEGIGYTASAQGTDTVMKGVRLQNTITAPHKDPQLLDSQGNIFSKSRPQYETYPATSIVSAKSNGCKGDGVSDDTAAIQTLLQQVAGTNKVAYFEHGAYLVKNTVTVPPNVMMTGEIWPLIVADSASFSDMANPKPVFRIGQSGGQQGYFQISDFIFETNGPAPGAVMVEWNLQSPQGQSGWWDTHVRIGGSSGTNLESPQCTAANGTTGIDKNCMGVFLMFHATKPSSGVYVENSWFWVADHNLDFAAPEQLTIYSARGVLIQSQGPVWLWGTASEHSILYNYQFDGAQSLFSGLMQSETPYYQPYPLAPEPFAFNNAYDDPLFTICKSSPSPYCQEAWGLRIYNSRNVLIYSTGLYSFFQDYQQTCDDPRNCQQNMIHIQSSQVDMYAVNTFAAENMIVDDDMGTVKNDDNQNWWCATVAYYFTGH